MVLRAAKSPLRAWNAPRYDVARLKTITYRAIKTTGTLIVVKSYLSNYFGVVRDGKEVKEVCFSYSSST